MPCLRTFTLGFAVLMLMPLPAALAAPLTTMQDVGAAITSCWTPPAGIKNSVVTLSFSLKRDGSLIGIPRPTEISVEGSDDERKAFIDAAVDAVTQCTPVELDPTLAQGIGGQVFTLPFTSSDRVQEIVPDNQ